MLDGTGPLELVRQKDMLLYLEEGLDRCKDAMDEIQSIAATLGTMKMMTVVMVLLATRGRSRVSTGASRS